MTKTEQKIEKKLKKGLRRRPTHEFVDLEIVLLRILLLQQSDTAGLVERSTRTWASSSNTITSRALPEREDKFLNIIDELKITNKINRPPENPKKEISLLHSDLLFLVKINIHCTSL